MPFGMFRPPGRKTIYVDLRIIFLIHVAIFDPLFSILDPYPSPLSPQHSLLSTEPALRSVVFYFLSEADS